MGVGGTTISAVSENIEGEASYIYHFDRVHINLNDIGKKRKSDTDNSVNSNILNVQLETSTEMLSSPVGNSQYIYQFECKSNTTTDTSVFKSMGWEGPSCKSPH